VRELLSEMNVPFVEHNIRRDPDARQRVVELLGMEAVPLTLIDGQMIIGFDRARIEALLA
jgi:glutaredoxin 3